MQFQTKAKNNSSLHRRRVTILVLALLLAMTLIGVIAFELWQRHQATNNPQPRIETSVITNSTDQPDETVPSSACDDYKVSASQPRVIEIPALDVRGCIQRVGIDQHENIAVPTNIHLAGWYTQSVLPGEKGVSLIAGHVLGRYTKAIFADMDTLKPNDTINITKGDGSVLAFEVVDTARYPVDEVMKHLFDPLKGVERQLTLITCGGTYDKAAQTYDERVVVRAKLVSGN